MKKYVLGCLLIIIFATIIVTILYGKTNYEIYSRVENDNLTIDFGEYQLN